MKYYLTKCVWEITLACCFSCKYCGSSGGKARDNELTTSECLNLADELHELGCRRVSLIGGEVFMRKDWELIVSRLTDYGISVNIITNGFLFDDSLVYIIKETGVESISVSVDAPRDIHDKYRQTGSFDRAINAIKVLAASGIPVSVISTLNRENYKSLGSMYNIIKDYPIYAWQLQACSPMGNAIKSGVDYSFDMAEVIDFVGRYALNAPFSLGVADNIGYFTENEGTIRGNINPKSYFTGCSAGISSIGIDSVGNIRGCESMYDERFIEGNVRERSLRDIWENPDNFAYNRKFKPDLLTGKCQKCDMGKYCGAGCRSYNYFVHGKLYESPYCVRGEEK